MVVEIWYGRVSESDKRKALRRATRRKWVETKEVDSRGEEGGEGLAAS
jgi:hypothetical protein